MEAKEIIERNLSYQTLQTAKEYLIKAGEPAESLTAERVGGIISNHFDILIDAHLSDGFGRAAVPFESGRQHILSLFPDASETVKDDLESAICNLFIGGFLNGYVVGVHDTETFINHMDSIVNNKIKSAEIDTDVEFSKPKEPEPTAEPTPAKDNERTDA